MSRSFFSSLSTLSLLSEFLLSLLSEFLLSLLSEFLLSLDSSSMIGTMAGSGRERETLECI